ncbi:MAG: hypothetical protein PHN69_05460 [Candidatus Pacebacteria bacterium]|nr:hypothetical protein [Candidatus Paceibacterota bacterium]
MKFEYGYNMYEKEKFVVAIVALVGMLFLNKYLVGDMRILGSVIGLISIGLILGMHWLTKKHGIFSFEVQDKILKIGYNGRIVDFLWSDIVFIWEDNDGLNIRFKESTIDFPIINSMVNYQNFRSLIEEKAKLYTIPFQSVVE